MKDIDYEKIILTEEEQNIFDLFRSSDTAFLTVQQFKVLYRRGLIKQTINGKSFWYDDVADGICQLSEKGIYFREFQNKKLSSAMSLKEISDTLKQQLSSVASISNSAKIQADLAVKKSQQADIKGWIAVILSAFTLFCEFAINHEAIIEFIKQLF